LILSVRLEGDIEDLLRPNAVAALIACGVLEIENEFVDLGERQRLQLGQCALAQPQWLPQDQIDRDELEAQQWPQHGGDVHPPVVVIDNDQVGPQALSEKSPPAGRSQDRPIAPSARNRGDLVDVCKNDAATTARRSYGH